jgi:hypothetical protein
MNFRNGLLLLILTSCFGMNAFALPKLNVGWVEKVKLVPGNLIIHAKLDTGADSSSIDAQDVEEFTRAGSEWVRFSIVNRYGDKITIENKIHRMALVKRHFGKTQRRKVIRIGICLGETYMQTDVTLINRKNFEYQMLLGRQFLAGNAVVDPAVTYTAEPGCEEKVAELSVVKKKVKRKKKESTNQKVEDEKVLAKENEEKIKKEPLKKEIKAQTNPQSLSQVTGSGKLENKFNSLPPAAVPANKIKNEVDSGLNK